MPPERTAGNNEHGGRGAKTICNPMVWTGRRRVVKNRHLQALSPAGETVPSRRHNQTDSESGKEVNEANTEEVPVSPFFLLLGQNSAEIKTKRGQDNSQPRSLITWCNLTRILDRAPKITESLIECVKVLITMPDKLQMIP